MKFAQHKYRAVKNHSLPDYGEAWSIFFLKNTTCLPQRKERALAPYLTKGQEKRQESERDYWEELRQVFGWGGQEGLTVRYEGNTSVETWR